MDSIRDIMQVLEESMTYYHHLDVNFRGAQHHIEVKMYGNDLVEWYFEGLSAKEHEELALTPDETDDIDEQVHDELNFGF